MDIIDVQRRILKPDGFLDGRLGRSPQSSDPDYMSEYERGAATRERNLLDLGVRRSSGGALPRSE